MLQERQEANVEDNFFSLLNLKLKLNKHTPLAAYTWCIFKYMQIERSCQTSDGAGKSKQLNADKALLNL